MIHTYPKKKLPLAPKQLERTKHFCEEQIDNGNLKVLSGIPDILRKDWLDENLDKETRACKHINVIPREWRQALENQCDRTVNEYFRLKSENNRETLSLLMWRGALAYLFGLTERNVKICHIEAKRNEKTLEVTVPMPLNKGGENLFRFHQYFGQIIIPDPMLASGVSNAFAIDMLNGFGAPNEKITLLCAIAAPEGIFHILNFYSGVKIIAATLDDHLNEDAYIIPGSGDVGEKYFYGNSITNFGKINDLFHANQWKHLKYLLNVVNK